MPNFMLKIFCSIVLLLAPALSVHAVTIQETASGFTVATAAYRWQVSKTKFTVFDSASINGQSQFVGGSATADFMGSNITFGAPSEFMQGNDWIELRGWAARDKNLWYVARYQFYKDSPHTKLSITLSDRHDNSPVEAHWHKYWDNRRLSNFEVTVNSSQELPIQGFVQKNQFSGGPVDGPEINIDASNGQPSVWSSVQDETGDWVAYKRVTEESKARNRFQWLPKADTGDYDILIDFGSPQSSIANYPHTDTQYEVNHAGGRTVVTVDLAQPRPIKLGSFKMNKDSSVALLAGNRTAPETKFIFARDLILTNKVSGEKLLTRPTRLDDTELTIAPHAFMVQDFWQHFPIQVFSNRNSFGVRAALRPEELNAGSSITLDLGYSLLADKQQLLSTIDRPPVRRRLPSWWSDYDGVLDASRAYDEFVFKTADIVHKADETFGNFGWRSYGDYQIGATYYDGDGALRMDWGGLQYDLTLGLGISWLRTGDPYLWHRWRAAVRNQMDTAISKFQPGRAKYGGQGRRKGDCTYDQRHICQEPIPAFSNGFRSLLLYHHYTGEEWAKEIARMQLDGLAYIANRDLEARYFLKNGDRGGVWALKGLVMAAKVFENEGTKYYHSNTYKNMPVGTSYRRILDKYMKAMMDASEAEGHYPGNQPVWKAQYVGALAEYREMALADGNAELADRVKRHIVMNVDTFLSKWFKMSPGDHKILYKREPLQWREAGNYSWFWIDQVTIAYKVTGDERYKDAAMEMYAEAARLYRTPNYQSVRNWSSVLTFPGLFFKTFLPGGGLSENSKRPRPPKLLDPV